MTGADPANPASRVISWIAAASRAAGPGCSRLLSLTMLSQASGQARSGTAAARKKLNGSLSKSLRSALRTSRGSTPG
jgi:hypothetical protein